MKTRGIVLTLALAVVALTATSAQAAVETTLTNCTAANEHCGYPGWIEDGGRKAQHVRNGGPLVSVFAWAECWPHIDGSYHADGRLMVFGAAERIDIDYIRLYKTFKDGRVEMIRDTAPGIQTLSGDYSDPRDQMFTTSDVRFSWGGSDTHTLHVKVKYSLRWNNTFLWTGPYTFSTVKREVC